MSYQNESKESSESGALLDSKMAAAAATHGAQFFNASADKITKARSDGPLTFRMLGFLGGLAMTISNGIAVLDRFFSFNYSGFVIALYGIFFGVIITILEAPGPCSRYLNKGTRYYAKFLEFAWGRGAFYFFVGTLQISNVNMSRVFPSTQLSFLSMNRFMSVVSVDWAVGGFMIFTGVTAMGVGIITARDLRLLKFSIKDEAVLKQMWDKHDADKNGSMDVKELTAFARDSGVEMTRNEIAAAFLALDKNFDDKITYEELYYWWTSSGALGAENSMTV